MKKNIILILVTSIIGFIGLYLFFYFTVFLDFDRKNYNVDKSWINGIGTLIAVNNCAECESKFKYTYNNINYEEGSRININDKIIGSKYWLKINPKLPDRYIPLNWKPVFTPDEKTNFTYGVIKEITSSFFERSAGINRDSLSKEYVVFNYYTTDGKLEGIQHLSPVYNTIYPNLKVGQKYEVEYWDEDYSRAIIHLDKPVKDTGR